MCHIPGQVDKVWYSWNSNAYKLCEPSKNLSYPFTGKLPTGEKHAQEINGG